MLVVDQPDKTASNADPLQTGIHCFKVSRGRLDDLPVIGYAEDLHATLAGAGDDKASVGPGCQAEDAARLSGGLMLDVGDGFARGVELHHPVAIVYGDVDLARGADRQAVVLVFGCDFAELLSFGMNFTTRWSLSICTDTSPPGPMAAFIGAPKSMNRFLRLRG